jgi:hypothetical protein
MQVEQRVQRVLQVRPVRAVVVVQAAEDVEARPPGRSSSH